MIMQSQGSKSPLNLRKFGIGKNSTAFARSVLELKNMVTKNKENEKLHEDEYNRMNEAIEGFTVIFL